MEFLLPPLDEDFIKKTHEEFETLKNSYGKDFFDNDYSWAKPYLNGKSGFIAVEESVGMERYRPYYIRASGKVHPTFIDITNFRDEDGKISFDRMIKPDDSLINIIDPAQLTMGCFCDVNNYFLEIYSGHEYEINLMLFEKLWGRLVEVLNKKTNDK